MKVKELIEVLESCDAEAEVVIMSQPNYPMEHGLLGVALREDCHDGADEPRYETDTAPSDVVLVEGAWLRYGNSAAWGAARTRPH